MNLTRPRKALAGAVLVALVALVLAAPAGAKIILVGPNLSSLTAEGHVECSPGCTVTQKTPSYTAPVTGTIVEWQIKGSTGDFELETLKGNKGTGGSSLEVAESGKSSFESSLPIKEGERFAIELVGNSAKLGYVKTPSARISGWNPILAVGETRSPSGVEGGESKDAELLANVKILPLPTIESVTPASGTVQELDTFTIKGENFYKDGITQVFVGSTPVNATVVNETEIVAEAFSFNLGPTNITVKTPAGEATAAGAFTFVTAPPAGGGTTGTGTGSSAGSIPPPDLPDLTFPTEVECVVPKLKGRTLMQAKVALANANCRLGVLTHRRYARGKRPPAARRGKVVGQVPGAGAHAAANSKVRLTVS
jgi:hypothetical protein